MKNILVLGGGLSGVYLSQELSDFGFNVFLVEQMPSIGGVLLDLGKVFPTDDCALCYPAAARFTDGGFRKCQFRAQLQFHPQINLHTNSELESYARVGTKFQTRIRKRRFGIDEDKCIGCGECITECQASHKDLDKSPIQYYHSQAIPRVPYISQEECDQCGICAKACEPGAIDLNWDDKLLNLDIDAIVHATGFREMTPDKILREFGYGELPGVMTQVELAQFIDPLRKHEPSLSIDPHKPLKHVALVTCVGSRDQRHYAYCSRLCCSYTLKHALMLREQNVDVTVFFMDIRTLGFMEDYYLRCRDAGVNFIRGRPNSVDWDTEGESLVVDYEDTLSQKATQLFVDLVVLATALIPEHNRHYLDNGDKSPHEGEFNVGSVLQPLNIPETIRDVDALCFQIIKYLKSSSNGG